MRRYETVGDAARLIIECPYAAPTLLPREAWPMAKLLVKRGLLEANPWTLGLYRCTARGEELRRRLLRISREPHPL